MVEFINKYKVIILVIVALTAVVVTTFSYLSMSKKGKEMYIEKFRKNQNELLQISHSLMLLEYEVSIEKELGEIIIRQEGNTTEISKYSLDDNTKSKIERAIKSFGIRRIEKTKTFIEFVYSSNKDVHSVVFASDRNQLIGYTNVEHLGDNWYYCYIFNE